MDFIFPLICMHGFTFSMNEINMHFKGHHADKIMMTYKAEGDGLQTDTIFRKWYTYQIFMWNDPVPKTYLSKSLYPLDAKVMALFDTTERKYHQWAMDNLYNSAIFFKEDYNQEEKLLTCDVTRKGMRSIPTWIKQE